jgi:isoquinoline 1-oxidoreductase beta subunit
MEGAVIFGMSLAFYGKLTMKEGKTEQGNFDTFKLIRMQEAPKKIHVEIVKSEKAPGGVGEPGVPPVAPAIMNAVFALTGERVRTLPLTRS